MSRIGKLPIKLVPGVKATLEGFRIRIEGGKGVLEKKFPDSISVELGEGEIRVVSKSNTKLGASLHGTWRAIIFNMVKGVSEGWSKKLELVGSGYRAQLEGKDLVLIVGFSNPVKITAPEGIVFKIEKNQITIEGVDKDIVGQVAAKVRSVRPPEPYKGKGISYLGETIRRKAGKAAKAQGAPA